MARVALLTPASISELLERHDLRLSRALGQNFLADPNTARRIVRLGRGRGRRPGARDRSRDRIADGRARGDRRVGHRARARPSHDARARRGRRRSRRTCAWSRATRSRIDLDALHRRADAARGSSSRTSRTTSRRRWWRACWRKQPTVTLAARDGAARGGGAARRAVRRQGLRRDLGEGRVLRARRRWSARCRAPSSCRRRTSTPALIRIVRHAAPPVDVPSPDALFTLVRAGFAQRRKMLRRALQPVLGERTIEVLERAGVDPAARAPRRSTSTRGPRSRARGGMTVATLRRAREAHADVARRSACATTASTTLEALTVSVDAPVRHDDDRARTTGHPAVGRAARRPKACRTTTTTWSPTPRSRSCPRTRVWRSACARGSRRASGLGGGSSDAAAALRYCAERYGLDPGDRRGGGRGASAPTSRSASAGSRPGCGAGARSSTRSRCRSRCPS